MSEQSHNDPSNGDRRFYVTTPIYYVNAELHIGHAYTTIVADALARWHRMFGRETRFLTGVDEHGQKVQRSADELGITPKEHCDRMVARTKPVWEKLGLRYDRFIRTTDADHERNVSALLQKVFDSGDIYLGEYAGYYHIADETFVTKAEVKPEDLQRGDVVELAEKNYFFRLEKHRQWLVDYIKANPGFIEPEERANWVLGQLREPIADLCISRPKERLTWGIPLPFDSNYVCYVWFDALINYLTGAGEGTKPEDFAPWWPTSCHLIGKDILQHHGIYWPIMLRAMGLPQPKKILAHGWWTAGAEAKIGKRQGSSAAGPEALREAAAAYAAARNDKERRVAAACDVLMASPKRPAAGPRSWLWLADEFGPDAMRYFLLREMTLGQDSRMALDLFVKRANDELANDLGNMAFRAGKMAAANFDGKLPAPPAGSLGDAERERSAAGAKLARDVRADIERFATQAALLKIGAFVREANVYFDARKPWALAKEGKRDELAAVLRTSLDAVAQAAALLSPVIPERSVALLRALGWSGDSSDAIRFDDLASGAGLLRDGAAMSFDELIFPRIDPVSLAEAEIEAAGIDLKTIGKSSKKADAPVASAASSDAKSPAAKGDNATGAGVIEIGDFLKVQLRVAEVLLAERVQGKDRLLRLQVALGEERRQIVAGIAEHYAPEALAGKRIVVVANLAPRDFGGGLVSHGMLLAAKTGKKLSLITVEDPGFASGASVG
jgi:methionyl-tRNA synthetase